MFAPKNLVLACSYCNGFSKKGTTNTIDTVDMNYNKCEFNIVHPYFDDPEEHFIWIPNGCQILISYLSDKGKKVLKYLD